MTTLLQIVQERYDSHGDPAHDFLHVMRVVGSCRSIGSELSADLEILEPAALLHDVINVPKNHPDRKQASEKASEEASGILTTLGMNPGQIEKVRGVILEHSYSLGLKPSSLESMILQDADRLDAIGAIGLMRMVTCGARLGSCYYERTEPIPKLRPLDDKRFTLDHLYTKLFKLGDGFHTEPAKREAETRIEFMRQFIKQLEREIP